MDGQVDGQKMARVFFRDQFMQFSATSCEISNLVLEPRINFCRDYDPPKTA